MYVEFKQSEGYLYWESIDAIIISSISILVTFWVTKRNAEDYQNSIDDKSLDFLDMNLNNQPEPSIHFE
jgi:hypothetical protein